MELAGSGVCFPNLQDDLRALLLDAAANGVPAITARAGGRKFLPGKRTAGAASSRRYIGHMRRILEIDPDRKTAKP